MIKIAYLIASSEIGGTEKMLMSMLDNLPPHIFPAPVVLVLRGRGRFTAQLRDKGIRVYVLNMKTRPLSFISLLIYLKREKPDIVHSFLFHGNIAGRLCGRLLKKPVVISSQRSVDAWRKPYHWFIDGITSRWADLIISNSHAGKKALVEKSGISRDKIRVIPNGISVTENIEPLSRGELGLSPGELIVGTVGNLRKAKGHIYLVNAAPLILSRVPNTRFIIVGQGELMGKLVARTEELGIADKFIFTGFRKDALRVMSLFDVFAFPSLWEGCPVGLLEAMSLGKPCVAFPAGDTSQILRSGENGLLVPSKSHDAMADAIMALLENMELRINYGTEAKRTVKSDFSLESMMGRYIDVYREFVQAKRSAVDFTGNKR